MPLRKLFLFFIILVGFTLFFIGMKKNDLNFYTTPAQLQNLSEHEKHKYLRLGGIVKVGSSVKKTDTILFIITDEIEEVRVRYEGRLPDLFREGQGVIAEGTLKKQQGKKNVFIAKKLLVKHDENYKPPQVASNKN